MIGRLNVCSASELPQAPFTLVVCHLGCNKQVSDQGLACFTNCRDLKQLQPYNTPVTGAG